MLGFLLNVVLVLLFLCLTTVSQAQSARSAGCPAAAGGEQSPRFGYRRTAVWLALSLCRVRRLWRHLGLQLPRRRLRRRRCGTDIRFCARRACWSSNGDSPITPSDCTAPWAIKRRLTLAPSGIEWSSDSQLEWLQKTDSGHSYYRLFHELCSRSD